MTAEPLSVHVPLGERAYDILIGGNLLDTAGSRLARLFPGRRFGIVTDTEVARQQLPRLVRSLDAEGIAHATVSVANGEASKSLDCLGAVVEGLLASPRDRGADGDVRRGRQPCKQRCERSVHDHER